MCDNNKIYDNFTERCNTSVDVNNIDSEKIQYILNEKSELTEIPKSECRAVEYPIKYRLKNAFEVFTRVNDTENYWVSNYGRCVNNLNHKNKNTFYEHKQGKCHYTIFEIDKDGSRWKTETSPAELVAKHFLVPYPGRNKVWHKDNDESNNWYKNLLTVSPQDYKDLKAGKVTWQELNLEQEYIEYENKATAQAYKVYNGIRTRCKDTTDNDNIRSCYDKSVMCQEWLDNPKAFVIWYLTHYYEVENEEMDVDKDLFGDGSGMYCPEFCCILPKSLNAILANSKKHYFKDKSGNDLPLGVKKCRGGYCGVIQLASDPEKQPKTLSVWATPDEAFAEYKVIKQADIIFMATKYKDKIPEHIYKRLLTFEVKPY